MAGQEDDPNGEEGDDPNGDEGDGGTAPPSEDGADQNTVHTVETLIRGPPTDPDRPADFFYQPTGLHVQPGDVVKFVFVTPDHNVVSYHPAFGMRRRVPTGVDAFSAPLHGWTEDSISDDQVDPPGETGDGGEDEPAPDTWLYAFETPGVYDLLCSPHETFGMVMRVVVGDETDAPFETDDPENLPEPRVGPVELARTVLTDPALRPSNIVDEGQVPWETLEATRQDQTSDDGESTEES